ncbi:hypothetical protein DFH29DRAFT_1002390 [Suillus ampliporus]|nr:hypothetical protein DFH29DRAFT_1002390 [Suillus ampliporus]
MFSARASIAAFKAFVTVLFLPQFHYPSTMHAHTMHIHTASTSSSLLAPPLIEEDILSIGKARMPGSKATSHPISSLPKPHYRRIPRAPRPDVHAFLPPPPYTESTESTSFLAVPNNTPATTPPLPPLSSSSSSDDSVTLSTPNGVGLHAQSRSGLIGLGFEGLEKGGGGVFDGLGRLSDGFRLSDSSSENSSDPPRTQVRSRAVAARPKKRHDVFFPCPHHSRSLSPVSFLARALPNTAMLQLRIRRRVEAGSPTPDSDPSRSTVSTELKRAAGMERRASLSRYGSGRVAWRV